MKSIAYERVIQWTAGPFSIACGWLATQITNHVALLGRLGIGHSQVGNAIFNTGVFAVSALVTYAAHHKWADNLVKYWQESGLTTPAGADALTAALDKAETDTAKRTPGQEADALREQLRKAGIKPEA